jgi:hypothetical protein
MSRNIPLLLTLVALLGGMFWLFNTIELAGGVTMGLVY